MSNRSRNDSRGLTLVELAIAMLVFLIGVLGLLQLIVVSAYMNQRSRDITLTTSLAQAKADQLMGCDFSATQLTRGGVIPLAPETHPIAANPAPLAGYADFFDYDGNSIPTEAAPVGTPIKVPPRVYFVRQWQVWSCDCGVTGSCTASCVPLAAQDRLKKITVTVTSMSPAFKGSFPSTTVVVYKSRIG